jgi:hypothetical protein
MATRSGKRSGKLRFSYNFWKQWGDTEGLMLQMEAIMMIGWYRVHEPTLARSCPSLISEVYRILQRPDPWTGLSQILLDPYEAELTDLGGTYVSHWWATPDAKVEEDPYYRMGVSLLKGGESVCFASLLKSYSFFNTVK